MPPYGLHPPVTERSVFAVQANKTFPSKPMTRASIMLVRGRYKLVYFFGYRERHIEELVRLYDLEGDPEELSDLAGTETAIVADMLEELKVRIREADQPYQ
jgi:arylsulfatase A-like enzyme